MQRKGLRTNWWLSFLQCECVQTSDMKQKKVLGKTPVGYPSYHIVLPPIDDTDYFGANDDTYFVWYR